MHNTHIHMMYITNNNGGKPFHIYRYNIYILHTPWANCLKPKAISYHTMTLKANSIFKHIHVASIHACRQIVTKSVIILFNLSILFRLINYGKHPYFNTTLASLFIFKTSDLYRISILQIVIVSQKSIIASLTLRTAVLRKAFKYIPERFSIL